MANETYNVIINTDIYTIEHLCTNVFRILIRGKAFDGMSFITRDELKDSPSRDEILKTYIKEGFKRGDFDDFPDIFKDGGIYTKSDFDELFPNPIMFSIVLIDHNNKALSKDVSDQIRDDLDSWAELKDGFLEYL